ncbi:MAG: glycosyltransferase [Candidatus Omnitrophica bacterium]|nr:glycosyltransferase [Candidatus Omnitrophota bacterium]
MGKRVLLLFISEHSGHHCASRAIEKALHDLEPAIETFNINSFNYTNPILERVINRAYMSVVKRTPEVWDYLYDNPKVLKQTQALRAMIHKFNKDKMKTLFEEFRPDAVVCTQAFPCGMVADHKKTFGLDLPIFGVLTDYAPHSYWIYNNVDQYIVPSKETGDKLIADGIEPAKIKDYGIPIDPKFRDTSDRAALREKLGLDKNKPCVLLMGGTQGLGPIKDMVRLLDRSCLDIQLIIACGTNKKLYKWLKPRRYQKKTMVLAYAGNIDELMRVSDIILTKPGGITTAEALAEGLPMLIVNPLPGQESMNTKFLLKEGVAVKAELPEDVTVLLKELLDNRNKLKLMSDKARSLSRPDSSVRIAESVLEAMAAK